MSSRYVAVFALVGLASGCGERPAPAPPKPTRAVAPAITAEAIVETPVCLGFLRGGGAAYVLTTNNDPSIPEWYVRVQAVGGGWGPDLGMMVQTTDPAVAKRSFAALVGPINDFIREDELVACTTAEAGDEQRVEVTVRGVRTVIAYRAGELVIAPEGQPPVVRPQTETTDLRLVAVYTAPTLPLVVVVLRDEVDGVVIVDRAEWVRVDRAAPIAR